MSDGMMDKGPVFDGRKFLVSVVVGLVAFTVVSLFVTLIVGRYFGNLLNKKALEHEREIQSQRMLKREASEKR